MKRALAMLCALALVGCGREAKLRRAIEEALPGYDQGPDRYEIAGCQIGVLPTADRAQFETEHVFEPADAPYATCQLTFFFRDFPRAGEMKPQPTTMRFVWIDNAGKWLPWTYRAPTFPTPTPKK